MRIILIILTLFLVSCSTNTESNTVYSISEMRKVMWKGELNAKVKLDTLPISKGFYGVGPIEGLSGEITVIDGKVYTSRIDANQNIIVEENKNIGAPFFVYAKTNGFNTLSIPDNVTDIKTLNQYLSQKYKDSDPFVFKLGGTVESAKIHVQNLPPNTKVSSPKEAHSGQVNFKINQQEVVMVGFYSNSAHGIYTHHDSNIHVHLITKDNSYMGHCDEIIFDPQFLKLSIAQN